MDRDQQAGAPIGTKTMLVHRAGKNDAAGEAGKRDEPQEHEIRVSRDTSSQDGIKALQGSVKRTPHCLDTPRSELAAK
jgi:hypothetical protein